MMSIIYSQFWPGAFFQNCWKSPAVSFAVSAPNTIDSHFSYVCLLSSVILLCHVSYLFFFLLQFCLLLPHLLIVWDFCLIHLGQNFFISWFTNPPTVIFQKVKKKNNFKKFFFLFIRLLDIICFVEFFFLKFCLCTFEDEFVKSDCPMQENYEIFKDLIQTVGLLY